MERQNSHLEKLAQRRPLTYVHCNGETHKYPLCPSTQGHGVDIDLTLGTNSGPRVFDPGTGKGSSHP